MRRTALALATVLAATLAADTGAGPSSGLYGTVIEGPTKPVCRVDEPCDRPAPNLRLRFLRSGRTVATVRTDKRGRYRIALLPGRYAVRLLPSLRVGGIVEPNRLTVPRGRFALVDFYRDTGIR
jgi:hypothetical protein